MLRLSLWLMTLRVAVACSTPGTEGNRGDPREPPVGDADTVSDADSADGAEVRGDGTAGDTSSGGDGAPGDVRPGDTDSPSVLSMQLSRQTAPAPSPIDVAVVVSRSDGSPWPGLSVFVEAAGASQLANETSDGHHTITVTPPFASGELEIVARIAGYATTASRTALVLPAVDPYWGQPEPVTGAVNTLGTEDSAEVSPDGEWLIVGTYSPVDVVCCVLGLPGICDNGPADSDSAACSTSNGPIAAPQRPGMLGADRVLSATDIDHTCPSLELDCESSGCALPPVASFGFRRQPDGAFDEPFVIGLDMDGCTWAPFGFAFVDPPAGTNANILFAWDRFYRVPATGNDIYYAQVTLGAPIILGRYAYSTAGGESLDSFVATPLALPDISGNQGNPAAGFGGVLFDSEGESEADVWLSLLTGDWIGGSFGLPAAAGLNVSGRIDVQPFAHGTRLFFGVDSTVVVSADLDTDFGDIDGWSDLRVDLTAEGTTRPGAVVSLGEPSVAHYQGDEWLYFVYYLKTDIGLNGNIGRVRRR